MAVAKESTLVPSHAMVAWVRYMPNEKSGFLIMLSEKPQAGDDRRIKPDQKLKTLPKPGSPTVTYTHLEKRFAY